MFDPYVGDDVSDILRTLRNNNIETAIISSAMAVLYDFMEGNRRLSSAIKGHKELSGMIFLNPNYVEESLEEMDRYLCLDNFVGLGELYGDGYIGQPLNCEGHKRFLTKLYDEYPDSVTLFHCGENNPKNSAYLAELAKKFPKLTFIAGHAGSRLWDKAISNLKDCSNVYFEISTPWMMRSKVEDLVEGVGAERVLFGSDLTLINPAYTLGMVLDAEITEREKELILYKNAERIFQL